MGREGRLMPEKRGKSYRKRRPTRLNLASLDPGGAWRICSSSDIYREKLAKKETN